jgi:LmbE family N-acetylglucosaminyl deacetylase
MDMQKTLLFVGAHPDDETFGMGGTLAKYVAAGVKVYYACATRGEAGSSDAESMKGYSSVADMRWGELECAAKVLGLAGIFHLGYRDSGMAGSADNSNPASLNMAPIEQAAGRIVKIIRDIKPQVVVTHDPVGGYRHPDHIATHRATLAAFTAAADRSKYPEAGPAFLPQKLYYGVFPKGLLKLMVKLMPFFGQNPHRFGRNHDVDLAAMVKDEFPVNARIKIDKRSQETRIKAAACYKSQSGGGPPRRGLFRWLRIFSANQDCFMRAWPEVRGRLRERDLFEGVL